jgi:hypothetical protein
MISALRQRDGQTSKLFSKIEKEMAARALLPPTRAKSITSQAA